jgi:hypothetical protein
MSSITGYVRLEPRARTSDVADGLAARVHDPLWFLARQWQFGEFLGEDAGTPSSMRLRAESSPLTRYYPDVTLIDEAHGFAYDPATTPLEPLVEREAVHRRLGWTPRLRAEAGLEFLRRLRSAGFDDAKAGYLATYPLSPLFGPERARADPATLRYTDLMAGRVPDGEILHADLAAAVGAGTLPETPEVDQAVLATARDWVAWCDTLFSEPDDDPLPWRVDRLGYSFALSAPTSQGEVVLEALDYRGGGLDWHDFAQRHGTGVPVSGPAWTSLVRTVVPTPLRFNGMPADRWWQFEDANLDLGRVDASASDLARLLLLEYALIYGGDFYTAPIELPVGSICTTRSLVVTDTFGVRTRVLPSGRSRAGGSSGWRMYALSPHGTAPTSTDDDANLFLLPPAVGQHLTGTTIEEVLLLRDEMANLVWAVERSVESGSGAARDRAEEYHRTSSASSSPGEEEAHEPQAGAPLTYRLATSVPDYWFPLVPVSLGAGRGTRLKLGRMAAPSGSPPEPFGELLQLGGQLLHEEEVPREGAKLVRTWHSARWIDGSTHVWVGRRRSVGRGEGSSGLRFDTVD